MLVSTAYAKRSKELIPTPGEGDMLIFLYALFLLLVVMGLGSIHYTLKLQLKNDERIINRLDLIIKELSILNNKSGDREH